MTEEKETPSEKTEVEIVVKPEMEETRPSEVPTEEIPVTFEETVEITTEEKGTLSRYLRWPGFLNIWFDYNFNLSFL
jgi:hypothetical protein